MEKLSLWIRITRATTVALVMSVALFLPGIARGFEFSLYETTAIGAACEICDILQLPNAVTGGYVVLLENALGSFDDRGTWSDVVIFGIDSISGILQASTGGTATSVQLLSDGCSSGLDGDITCFPSSVQIASYPHATVVETGTSAPTVYFASPNTYNIYSDGDATGVPEPGSLLLLGSGLVGLGLWGRNRFKAVKA